MDGPVPTKGAIIPAAVGYGAEISVEDGIAELVKLYRFYTPNSFVRPI